jgi:predicted nucleic acid-binding Zn ribbon protein
VKRVSDILAAVYRQGRDPKEADQDLVFCYWKEAAGGRLAQVSRPIHFTGNLLVVEVDSPEWIAALEAVRLRIHAKLNAAIGSKAVGRILFRAASTLRKPAARAETADPSLQMADGIRDPQLRRVYLASKRAAEKGR